MKVNSLDKITAASLGRDMAKSMRPHMTILSWTIYTCIIVNHKGYDIVLISLGLILFIAMYGVVALQNDISDRETDILNQRKDIPYARGHLTQSQLTYMMVVMSFVATVVGAMVSSQSLPWIGLYIILGYLYSGPAAIKSRGIYAALLLGFCYGAMPWLIAGSIVEQLNSFSLLAAAFMSFVFSSGIIVLKDFKDITGDKATNKKTLLVIKGPRHTRLYYLAITTCSYILLSIYAYLTYTSLVWTGLVCIIGFLSYWLLADKSIFSSSKSRAVRGKWARALFFVTILTTYSFAS